MEVIRWIDAAGECVCIHTAKGSQIVRQFLQEVESQLDPQVFVRVHESAIMRRDPVRWLVKLRGE